jgi:hypothetical protein
LDSGLSLLEASSGLSESATARSPAIVFSLLESTFGFSQFGWSVGEKALFTSGAVATFVEFSAELGLIEIVLDHFNFD